MNESTDKKTISLKKKKHYKEQIRKAGIAKNKAIKEGKPESKKRPGFIRKSVYSVDQVLAKVVHHAITPQTKKAAKRDFDGDMIGMGSQRYQVFKYKGTTCVCCGLKGSYFAKERQRNVETYHFNLYGINEDGLEVLMTKDHIIPKSKGGKNELENYQPMCTICNREKADKMPEPFSTLAS